MDVNVTLTDQESAALAALADKHHVTLGAIVRERLNAPLAEEVRSYLESRGETAAAATISPDAPPATSTPAADTSAETLTTSER